jgi:hypothetical protein
MAKKAKKEEKRRKKLEKDESGDDTVRLSTMIDDVRRAMTFLDLGSALYVMGEQMLETLEEDAPEETMEMAQGYLEKVYEEVPAAAAAAEQEEE